MYNYNARNVLSNTSNIIESLLVLLLYLKHGLKQTLLLLKYLVILYLILIEQRQGGGNAIYVNNKLNCPIVESISYEHVVLF